MEELLRNIPPVTKVMIASTIILSAITSMNFMSPKTMLFDMTLIKNKFQIWRVLTSLFYYGNFSVYTFIRVMLLYQNSRSLEQDMTRLDYLYFVIVIYMFLLLCAPIFQLRYLSDGLFMAITYLYSKRNRYGRFHLMWIPIAISTTYMPWVLLLLNFDAATIIGIAIGHIYYFFEDVFPRLRSGNGFRLFKAPDTIERIIHYFGG